LTLCSPTRNEAELKGKEELIIDLRAKEVVTEQLKIMRRENYLDQKEKLTKNSTTHTRAPYSK